MSSFKTIKDLMSGAASGMMFRGELLNQTSSIEATDKYDGHKEEMLAIGLTERNLLAGIDIPDNFTTEKDNANEIKINCTTVSTCDSSTRGVRELTNTNEYVIKPFSKVVKWHMKTEGSDVRYSSQRGQSSDTDSGIMGHVRSMCSNLSDSEVGSLPMTLIGERITQGQNMQHMIMKMYLMLMDLNLSVCTRRSNRSAVRGNTYPVFDNLASSRRLNLITRMDVVVDSEGFTPEELGVLVMASWSYPSIKYCGEDNLYTACHMDSDRLAIVSNKKVDVNRNVIMSPMEMYRNIVSICCKLDCTDDMRTAFSLMRGKMQHMQDVVHLVEDRVLHCGVNKSVSFSRSLGGSNMHNKIPGDYPSYISTSISLITDHLLGKMYELVATMLVEKLGGYGDMMCDDVTCDMSREYNGMLRDYGVSCMNNSINAIMLEWECINNSPYCWSINNTWKPYIIALTNEMRSGRDVPLPQLTFDLAFSNFNDTCWGAMKNWKGYNGSGVSELIMDVSEAKRKTDEKLRTTAAYTWAMGVRQVRPRVFNNAFGSKEVRISTKEYNWMRGVVGSHTMTHVSYTLCDEYQGREDWTERAGTSLIRTSIDGVKCTVVMSETDQEWKMMNVKSQPLGAIEIQETMGNVLTEDVNAEEYNVESVTKDNMRKMKETKNIEKMFEGIKGIVQEKKVKLNSYELVDEKKMGDRVNFNIVNVPGDGTCGLHAIVKSMEDAGMIRTEDANRAYENFDNKMEDEDFHHASDIAAALLEYGIPLRLYDRITEGKVRIINYGDTSSGGVAMYRDGMHFQAVVEGKGKEYEVLGREGGDLTNAEQSRALKEMRRFYK